MQARASKPCILFFDELDSLAPMRGKGSDSGGVMDRVVSQLLTEIDGMGSAADVFVIGATNRPDLLDAALLRPGRFDRLLYLGICQDRDAQLKVLKALTRKFHVDSSVDLMKVVTACPSTFTGADFYAVASGALANAMQRCAQRLEAMHLAAEADAAGAGSGVVAPAAASGLSAGDAAAAANLTLKSFLAQLPEDQLTPVVTLDDFLLSLSTVVPSVSPEELVGYERLRRKFCRA